MKTEEVLKTVDFATGCEVVGVPPVMPKFEDVPEQYKKYMEDMYVSAIVHDAVNKETSYEPNYDDDNLNTVPGTGVKWPLGFRRRRLAYVFLSRFSARVQKWKFCQIHG